MSESFRITLTTVLAVYGVMACGAFCGWIGWFDKTARQNLLKIVVNLLLPCLIIVKVLGNPIFNDVRNLYGPPLYGFLIISGSIALAWLCGRFLPKCLTTLDTPQKLGTFAGCAGMLNYGYVPIPLIAALFPNNDGAMGILMVLNVGTEIALWTVCVSAFSGKFDKQTMKSLINIPIIVITICLAIDFIGSENLLPLTWRIGLKRIGVGAVLWQTIQMLSVAMMPLSLLCVGGAIADQFHFKDFTADLGKTLKLSTFSTILRLAVFPLIILFLAKTLPCSQETRIVLVIYASMASATFPIVLAEIYGGDIKTALLTSLSNSFIAIVTTPIWITVGLKWIGVSLLQ